MKSKRHTFVASIRLGAGPPVIVLACSRCAFFWLLQSAFEIEHIMKMEYNCVAVLLPGDLPAALENALHKLGR